MIYIRTKRECESAATLVEGRIKVGSPGKTVVVHYYFTLSIPSHRHRLPMSCSQLNRVTAVTIGFFVGV